MEINYGDFLPLVKALLKEENVGQFLRPPLSDHFDPGTQFCMRTSLNSFFEEFDKVKENKKYADFMEVTKDISEWIPLFLGDTAKAKEYRKKFNVIFQLIHIEAEGAVNSFPMDEVFLHKCQNKGLISKQSRDDLITVLNSKGATTAKYEFIWKISIKSQNYYGMLLQLLYEEKTDYIENFCDDLHKSIAGCSEREAKEYIMVYAESIIDKNMNVNIREDEVFNNLESDGGPGRGTGGEMRVKEGPPSISDVNMNERTLEEVNNDFDNLECDGRPGEVLDDRNCPGEEELLSLNEEMITDTPESQRPGASAKDEENVMDSDDEDKVDPESCDNLFGQLKDKHVDDILNFSSEGNKSRIKDRNVLNIRQYQEELAHEGIKGQNVLICAPTGSGKTVVAVKIVEEHLKKTPNAKVAFVVHRIALVEQQYAQFSKYLNCKITRLSGSMKATCAPLVGHIPCFDVFVMTSDILRNALEQENETKLESINSFTMILFDECHNCDKKHPYNQIMNHYFKTKREENKVPQIIGLTASTGTNKANTMQIAMKRLYTLCANLDTYTVSTVKVFLVELCTNQSKPIEDVSEWIGQLLITTDNGVQTCKRYNISKLLINQNPDFFLDNLTFNNVVIDHCLRNKLISFQTAESLQKLLKEDGETFAKHKFQSILHIRSIECYSKFLFLCWKYNKIYLEIFYNNLYSMLEDCTSDEEADDCIKLISATDIEEYSYDSNDTDVAYNLLNLYNSLEESGSLEVSFPETELKNNESDTDSFDENKNDDVNFDKIFGEYRNKDSIEMLNFQPEATSSEGDSLQIRQYQDELAKKGVEGRNVLICAPTSSGKTVVAIKIIEEHLRTKTGRKAALVVPTNVLVDQQFKLFHKYLGKKWKISKICGSTKSFTVSLSKQINDSDIFVFTCDILRNSLEDVEEPLDSIGRLSLIIFDECHHCDKDHSYNKVMDHYFKSKLADIKVPQIIGMTASTGTDKAKDVDAALKSLFSLCANLDCQIVSTVKSNIEELNKTLPRPSNDLKSPGARSMDLFECKLLALMNDAEEIVVDIFKNKKPIGIPDDKYHDKYLSFVKGLTNYAQNLLTAEESKGVKITEIFLETLFRALIVNHLFNRYHALEMIKENIKTTTPITCLIEDVLRKKLKNFLFSTSLDQDHNPCLDCLKEEIVKQIKKDKTSKIIVFVKEVRYANILEKEIQAAKLGFIQSKALVGTNKASDQGGISKTMTEDIVSKFRRGIINLIFATSVAEEGLDVEKCNLVIRYGHVTNEISMVQSRGRARASESQYIVIVPHKLKWQINKENINKVRESMMYKAIERFQAMKNENLQKELAKYQEKRLALRSIGPANNNVDVAPKINDSLAMSLHCNKCQELFCKSSDIRLANGTSYVVIRKEVYAYLKVKKGQINNFPLECYKCENILGNIIKVDSINLPTIKISQSFVRRGTETFRPKKWKDVPFTVPQFSLNELLDGSNCGYKLED